MTADTNLELFCPEKITKNFTIFMNETFTAHKLTANEIALLVNVFTRNPKRSFFSIRRMAEKLEWGERRVRNTVNSLIKKGFVYRKKRGRAMKGTIAENGVAIGGNFVPDYYAFYALPSLNPYFENQSEGTEKKSRKNKKREECVISMGGHNERPSCINHLDLQTSTNTNTTTMLSSSQSVSLGLTDGQIAEPENLSSFSKEEFATLKHLLRNYSDFDLMPLKVKCFVDTAVKYLEEAIISGKFRLPDVIGKLEDIINKEGSLFTCLTTINQECEKALENLHHPNAREKFLASTFCNQFRDYKPETMVKSVPKCAETESDSPAAASNGEQFTELECLMQNCEYDSMKQELKNFVPDAIRYMKNAVISGSAELSDIISKLKEIISKEGSLLAFIKKIMHECGKSLKKMKYASAEENYLTSVVYKQLQKYKPKESKATDAETQSGQAPAKHAPEHQGRPMPSQRSKSESPTLNFREMLMQLQSPLAEDSCFNTPLFDNIENFKEYFGTFDYDEWRISKCIIPYSFKENPANLENALKFLVGLDDMPADTFDESEYKAFVEKTIYFLAKEIHAGAEKGLLLPDNLISRLNHINMDINEHGDTLRSFMSDFYKKFQKAITQYPVRSNEQAYITKMLVNYLNGEYQAQDMIGIGNGQVLRDSFADSGAKSSKKKASSSEYDYDALWKTLKYPGAIDS